MSEETPPKKKEVSPEKKTLSPVIIAAIIGLIGTLITTFLNSPVLLALVQRKTEVPPTATVTLAVPAVAATETATLLPAPPVATSTTTETAVLVPTEAESPPLFVCLDQWEAFSSDSLSPVTPEGYGNCNNAYIDELGIAASEEGLSFGLASFKETGVYGLSTELPRNATIELTVFVSELISSEFWIGFSESPDPQADSVVYALAADTGDVKIYSGSTSSPKSTYPWVNLAKNIEWLEGTPRQYTMQIELEGNKINMTMNEIEFTTEISTSTKQLFIGYRTKPASISSYLDIELSGTLE